MKSGTTEILISDESARWLTFMLSKIIFDPFRTQMRHDSSQFIMALQDKLKKFQSTKASTIKSLKNIETIQIKSIGIGNYYPNIDSYQLCYDAETECCAFKMKCSWQDCLSLEIESALCIIGLISLPFSISVKMRSLKFTAQLRASNDSENFEISCLPDDYFLIDLEVSSLLGHRTKLKDLPKIKNAVVEAIKKILCDTLISPKYIQVPFPKLQDNFFWACEKSESSRKCTDDLDTGGEIIENSNNYEEVVLKPEEFENSIHASLNVASFKEEMVSDESEPMHIFLDSRYDFDDEIETHTLISNTKTK